MSIVAKPDLLGGSGPGRHGIGAQPKFESLHANVFEQRIGGEHMLNDCEIVRVGRSSTVGDAIAQLIERFDLDEPVGRRIRGGESVNRVETQRPGPLRELFPE